MLCGGELVEDVLFDDLRSATLARRVVGIVTRTRETTMGSRDGPGADTRPTGMASDYRG
jgi:hypothetical protein